MKKLLLTLAFVAAASFALAADEKKSAEASDCPAKAEKSCAADCEKACCKEKKSGTDADRPCCEKEAKDQKPADQKA